MIDAFDESFENNTPDAKKSMKADVDRLLGTLEPVKPGDQLVFTYVPANGDDSRDQRCGQSNHCGFGVRGDGVFGVVGTEAAE